MKAARRPAPAGRGNSAGGSAGRAEIAADFHSDDDHPGQDGDAHRGRGDVLDHLDLLVVSFLDEVAEGFDRAVDDFGNQHEGGHHQDQQEIEPGAQGEGAGQDDDRQHQLVGHRPVVEHRVAQAGNDGGDLAQRVVAGFADP
ncbi:hypothetical protein SDC9_193444 [bioreactor metagenome]|uniref:Uncharacterized protein n=1 Tax=bioreactor metagenome TaxID=1076179 RepID=A0A645I650_9ZZZZ